MDLKTFKSTFDPILKEYLDGKIASAKKLLAHKRLNSFRDHSLDYIFGWGKRVRPYVANLLYQGMGGENQNEMLRFSMVFEIFHNMALIHDDIIDESKLRHNVECVHTFIEKQTGSHHIAEWQAILVGDLLLCRMYERLDQNHDFDIEKLQRARKNIHEMIHEVVLGEMIDVDMMLGEKASEEDIEKKNLYKTARYSFTRPMVTWAILAGASEEQIELITQLGTNIGIAYQVRDDLMDLVKPDISKTIFGDIQEWAQTTFTNYIYTQGSSEDKALLEACMGQQLTQEQISSLQDMLHASGAINYGKDLIDQYGQKAFEILEKIDCQDTEVKQALAALTQKIISIEI